MRQKGDIVSNLQGLLMEVFYVKNSTPSTSYMLHKPKGKTYVSELDVHVCKLVKRAPTKTNQISFAFMLEEDRKLDAYIEERIQKEDQEWLRLNPQGVQFRPTKKEVNKERKLQQILSKLSAEELRELFK